MKEQFSKYNRNNLDKSSSPYLLQHLNNPVWWQEWSEEVINYAVKSDKPLLVSVGYSTCHWCHVMASEAFSDERTARFLNDNFVSIKVDKEQRPDIDQFMMSFIQEQGGRGGWPLNVLLTPSLNPIFALTYAPAYQKSSVNSFLSVIQQVYTYYKKHRNDIPSFSPEPDRIETAEETSLVQTLADYFDTENGGFGNGQKFPSHATLLFLLYQIAASNNQSSRDICFKTLEAIRMRGLNDHLQGGIYRYCVDSKWTIPHFEKMLYDQAMILWTYSLAYKVFDKIEYKAMAESILKCLDESFLKDGLYISAHDADTDHKEGATYIWSYDELKQALSDDEFLRFIKSYDISESGNFEGSNHLIRRNDEPLRVIEDKLLSIRRSRVQPSNDDKIMSGNNALAAVAFIQAGRMLNRNDLHEKATILVQNILSRFWDGKSLAHSYYNGNLQNQGFLFDAAALLSALSMLIEDNSSWQPVTEAVMKYVLSFKEGDQWIESRAIDFRTINATCFDQPVPSGISLAEFGLKRVCLLNGTDLPESNYRQPYQYDFYNISAMILNGLFHIVTSRKAINWNKLPVNSIQLRGKHDQDCYKGTCVSLENGRVT
jgi:uncharacterized protein